MIENINFRELNIDKYLKETARAYFKFNEICNLPLYEKLLNELLFKGYKRSIRRIEKGILIKPIDIFTKSEKENKSYYENEIKELKEVLNRIPFLDLFSIDMLDTSKKYLYFDVKELEQFKPKMDAPYTWIAGIIPTLLDVSIDEIEIDFKNSPLGLNEYYKRRLNKLKGYNFIYLDNVLNGDFIGRLDNLEVCREFCYEMVKVKEIQYLENKIFDCENPKIDTETEPELLSKGLTQKQIALLFKCLFELDVFSEKVINSDHTKQTKLIALMVGINIPDKPNNWNFYKYWNSIQSINDDKQILTKSNLEIVLNLVKTIDFKELEDNVKQKIKELK